MTTEPFAPSNAPRVPVRTPLGSWAPASSQGVRSRPGSVRQGPAGPVLGTLLAMGLAGCPAAQPVAAGGAELVIAEPEHDFGTVWEGTVLTHAFEMSAGGSEELVIHKIKPSCGCTVAEVWLGERSAGRRYEEGQPIPAGERIEFVTSFSTARRHGSQSKPVSIYHSGAGGRTEVHLVAEVKPLLETNPEPLDLGRLAQGETREGTVEVRVVDGSPVGLTVDPDLPAGIAATLEAVDPGPEGRSEVWQVQVTLGPGAPDGPLRERVQLVTDREIAQGAEPAYGAGDDSGEGAPGGEQPAYLTRDLTVMAQVLPPVSATPRSLSFGQMRPDAIVARTARVNLYDPNQQELPAIETRLLERQGDQPFEHASVCRVTVRPVDDVLGWDVELALDEVPTAPGEAFQGRLVLSFPETALPELSIPFSGFLRATAGAQ